MVAAGGVLTAGAGLLAVLVVLAGAVGWQLTVRSVAAVAVLTALHGGLASLAAPRAGVAVRLVLAAAMGLAAAGVAVWVSGVLDWWPARWVVLALPALAWLPPAARGGWAARAPGTALVAWGRRSGAALWGVGAAWALAAPALAGYFAPLGDGIAQRQFYVDIPWHIALTAETLDRAPAVYPWIPDVPIGYSWLFFGTLGLLGNLSGASAAQLVLQIGPAVLALLVPAALAAAAWVVSRSRVATVAAPLLYALTRAPFLADSPAVELTPQWVLINRDSTNALVLAVVILLCLRLARTGPDRGAGGGAAGGVAAGGVAAEAAFLGAVLLLTFAAAGGRGGAVAPLLGAAGLAWLVSLRRAEHRRTATWTLGTMVLAVVAATVAVTRSSGSFRLDPVDFLPPGTTGPLSPTVAAAGSLVVMLAMIAVALAVGAGVPVARPAAPVLVGAALAGVLGMALFGHPAFSQLYFFHAGWPALVVALSVVLAGAVRALGPLVALALVLTALAVDLAITPPSFVPPTAWTVRLAVAALGAGALLALLGALLARRHGWRRTAGFGLPVLVLALQPWGVPEIQYPAAVVRPAPTPATVSDTQLEVLAQLRTVSAPDELVATNKHCLGGRIDAGTCDARWFTVAAFSERRVLVEGWSYDYTWTSSGNDNREPYWDPALLQANDGFIAAPDPEGCRQLVERGVRWLYVDHRAAWSPALSEHADLVRAEDDASLYRLRPGC